jgi:hypothetical protein
MRFLAAIPNNISPIKGEANTSRMDKSCLFGFIQTELDNTMQFLFVAVLLIATTLAGAQDPTTSMTQTTRDRINFSGLNIPNSGTLFGFVSEPGKMIGDSYLDTTWQAGTVRFYGRLNASTDSLAGVPVRLDLLANEVEIKAAERDIRVAKAPTVRYLDVNNRLGTSSRYINVREYRGEADALSGFFEQTVTGKLDLLLHPTIYVRRANFNPALNTGRKDDELVKKSDWYIAQERKAMKFQPSRKALLALMDDKKDQIVRFLKTANPNLKSRSGLASVVAYYNSL